jgi:hypothetical protein
MSDADPLDDMPVEFLRKVVADLSPEEGRALLGTYGYFHAKAKIYLRKGPDAYRQDDFFRVPRAEWSAEALARLEHGFMQIAQWKGLTADTALEEIDLADLYHMIEVTHFRLKELTVEHPDEHTAIATAEVRHRMDGRELRLMYRASPSPHHKPSMLSRLFGRGGDPTPVADEFFGYTAQTPILCHEPVGERIYLHGLRCPNGHPFSANRLGSMSGICPNPRSHRDLLPEFSSLPGCIVDKYELECQEGEHTCKLFFDMYHPDAPPQPAPRGLSHATSEG